MRGILSRARITGLALHSFTSIHCRNVISRELCRDTCARNLPARKFRSKNGFARGEMRDDASPCPSSVELRTVNFSPFLFPSFSPFFSLETCRKITIALIRNFEFDVGGRFFVPFFFFLFFIFSVQ